jgi:hypothetical protein
MRDPPRVGKNEAVWRGQKQREIVWQCEHGGKLPRGRQSTASNEHLYHNIIGFDTLLFTYSSSTRYPLSP